MLSALAAQAIAVPLSLSFPAPELRYILENSQALMLLSSAKFQDKADDILKEGIENKPIWAAIEKALAGTKSEEPIKLEEVRNPDSGGMMLYTSGTTSKPVSNPEHHTLCIPLLTSRRKASSFLNPSCPPNLPR